MQSGVHEMVASAQLPLNFAFFCVFSRIICDINAATLCGCVGVGV